MLFLTLYFPLFTHKCFAQYNTDRLITIGRSALYYEDYVLSIQYFNQVIAVKPYLYEPWFFRGVAKYYLDDFAGAESDCSHAIERNPYVTNSYELRGLCRIRLQKYETAAADYTVALKYDPENQGLWHNRVLCYIRSKDYERALGQLDTMVARWPKYADGYSMRAEVYMLQEDTAKAIKALDKSLEIDPYDGNTWAARSIISLSRSEWKESEAFLDKAIHLLPKNGGYYINRALARYNQNNLRGAMADYDTALDLEPNNFLGHYNRGLLRAQVGDDNRGIEDFDFVLKLEPDNMLARFNRGLLRDQTGDLRGAIDDYTKVIDEYPNFWTGLHYRAGCYRRLGMNRQAEQDEFRILKAQMDKRYGGKQPKMKKHPMRKRSDEDMEKYNQLVVADDQEVQNDYKNDYRGRVQNRKVEVAYLPMYELALEPVTSEVKSYVPFDEAVETFNRQSSRPLFVVSATPVLNEKHSKAYFAYIDSLSAVISDISQLNVAPQALLLRAVTYSSIQNFEAAIDDLSTYLQMDSLSSLALWQRAVCQSKINDFQASEGTNIDMKTANVLLDLSAAIRLSPRNAYLYYNRGNLYVRLKDYSRAIDDYTQALTLDPQLAEAYYNRGLALFDSGKTSEGIADLSKAGELGLYTAYSLIKKYREK
ncbi:MAG: tetratricopeptide repeat protein [Prevotella sp.]|nr:tetratricopeptide repeat protein [Prevotella sp.]